MAQDDPADTAGPSSPPPRLPEGWLPQWEGVERKWYYVQRTTGKSQWEIPTEPLALSPSTTPTSIGNGPSQAPPSRQPTNSSPTTGRWGPDEQFEIAVGGSRYPSSQGARVDEQSLHPLYDSLETNANIGQLNRHMVGHYGQPVAAESGEYGSSRVTGHVDSKYLSFFYPDKSHSMQQMHQHHPPQSGCAPLSQQFFDSYPSSDTSQPFEGVPVGYNTHTSSPYSQHSESGYQAGVQRVVDPMRADSRQHPLHVESLVGHSASQSNPRQTQPAQGHQPYRSSHTALSSLRSYPSGSFVQSQYESTGMGRTQSGPDRKPLGFPATIETQGDAKNYQNPLVQAGVQQYLPRQLGLHPTDGRDYRSAGQSYPVSIASSNRDPHSRSNISSRTAVSDPQFVSGPWASSTPPNPDRQPQPPHYG